MVIADQTIWTGALRGQTRAFDSLFNDLLVRGDLWSPGLVFAQLLTEVEDADLNRVRAWASQVGMVDEPMAAWLAAGDLSNLLVAQGAQIALLDCYVAALAIREQCPLWSLNPRFEAVARVIPLDRYLPPGMAGGERVL